jgi:hypothetical protein
MTARTYLAFVTYTKVQEIKNFGPFIFEDQDMVMLLPNLTLPNLTLPNVT